MFAVVDPRRSAAALAAARRYERFTGHVGEVVGSVVLPPDDALLVVGECEGVAYRATRDGVTESYMHEFRASSRPTLAASPDGLRLYLVGGSFRFGPRGIVDI